MLTCVTTMYMCVCTSVQRVVYDWNHFTDMLVSENHQLIERIFMFKPCNIIVSGMLNVVLVLHLTTELLIIIVRYKTPIHDWLTLTVMSKPAMDSTHSSCDIRVV